MLARLIIRLIFFVTCFGRWLHYAKYFFVCLRLENYQIQTICTNQTKWPAFFALLFMGGYLPEVNSKNLTHLAMRSVSLKISRWFPVHKTKVLYSASRPICRLNMCAQSDKFSDKIFVVVSVVFLFFGLVTGSPCKFIDSCFFLKKT